MTYLEQFILANEAEFQHRVLMAALDISVDVMNESAGTTNHAERAAFARTVIGTEGHKIAAITETLCGAIDTLTLASTDAEIKTALSSVWDALSGVAT